MPKEVKESLEGSMVQERERGGFLAMNVHYYSRQRGGGGTKGDGSERG